MYKNEKVMLEDVVKIKEINDVYTESPKSSGTFK